jgi:hypothetical protein
MVFTQNQGLKQNIGKYQGPRSKRAGILIIRGIIFL